MSDRTMSTTPRCGVQGEFRMPDIPVEARRTVLAAASPLIDRLTGLLDRRAFFELAAGMLKADRADMTLSAILLDIDHFKTINDTYGNDVGDDVLRKVAAEAAAKGAIFGRLGSATFAGLFAELDRLEASVVADRLRLSIAALQVPTAKGALSVTASFGVAQWQRGETIDQLLKRADLALYLAKSGGRNRVMAADDFRVEWLADRHDSVVRATGRDAAVAKISA